MVDSKKIGIAGAAVVLVTLVTIFGTSYMADFENNPRNVSQNDSQQTFEYIALGSETATVTIIEIGDYQCEMCKRWFDTARPQIIENYVITGDVNLIFIDMPFLGNDSQHASAATYCAEEGKPTAMVRFASCMTWSMRFFAAHILISVVPLMLPFRPIHNTCHFLANET